MKATTMLDTIGSLLGAPTWAIPLSFCRVQKPYLLERAGIPGTGTAVFFALPYLVAADAVSRERNLSLYAVPRDYHGYVRELEDTLLPALREAYPVRRFALFADHSPIAEVEAAAKAGLGVLGLNGLLITPDYGSFVFLCEIITDADYTAVTGRDMPNFPADPPLCERCGACLAACPAGCCGGDRTGCLSALTQKKGALTPDEGKAIQGGGLLWGCDTCQLACPHNQAVIAAGRNTPIPYFLEHRLPRLSTAALDTMSDGEFASRAYAWRGRAVIRRNASLLEPTHASTERRKP